MKMIVGPLDLILSRVSNSFDAKDQKLLVDKTINSEYPLYLIKEDLYRRRVLLCGQAL